MTKRILLAMLLASASTYSAMAQGRPLSTAMTCAQAQALVVQRGFVVMGFTADTYDRVVSGQRYCLYSDMLVPLSVPTRDTRYCPVGYTCREGDFRD